MLQNHLAAEFAIIITITSISKNSTKMA